MACNFRMNRKKKNKNLHLWLKGDFDGSSAHELLNCLRDDCSGFHQVVIHTDYLKKIIAFGCVIFQTNYTGSSSQSGLVVFSGKNAEQIAPHGVPVRNE